MDISDKLKFMWNSIDNGVYSEITRGEKVKISLDFLWNRIIHKTYLIDYLQYQFYWLNRRGKARYIEYHRLHEIMRVCNDKDYLKYFDNKELFNKSFHSFLNREFLSLDNCTFEEFSCFTQGHKRVFLKPKEGSFGKDTELIEISANTDIKALYDRASGKPLIMEEAISQHKSMSEFNASSVNTLRITTLVCPDGKPKVMTAVFRAGRAGKIADNFHHFGLAALIDIETGIVKTTAIDREVKKYVLHPDSHKQITGFVIPKWKEIMDTVKRAALVIPEVRYVGWDVCLSNDGKITIIEGNHGADPDVTQTPDLVGKWELYKPFVEELKGAKH